MEVRLFFVYEKRIRDPDVFDKIRSYGQRLDARLLREPQPRIRPKLPEVKIQRKVLMTEKRTEGIRKAQLKFCHFFVEKSLYAVISFSIL